MQPDELSSEAQRSTPRMPGEEEKVISTYEEAFRLIKEATGITDVQVRKQKEEDLIALHMVHLMRPHFTYVGDRSTFHLPEGDAPTSGEPEGGE